MKVATPTERARQSKAKSRERENQVKNRTNISRSNIAHQVQHNLQENSDEENGSGEPHIEESIQ